MLENDFVWIKVIEHDVGIAAVTGREHNQFKVSVKVVQESNSIRANINAGIDCLSVLHLYSQGYVRIGLCILVTVN